MRLPIVVWSEAPARGALRVVLVRRGGPATPGEIVTVHDAHAVVERASNLDATGQPAWERVEPAEQGTHQAALTRVAWALAEYVGGNPS